MWCPKLASYGEVIELLAQFCKAVLMQTRTTGEELNTSCLYGRTPPKHAIDYASLSRWCPKQSQAISQEEIELEIALRVV